MKEIQEDNVCEDVVFKNLFDQLSQPLHNFLIYRGSEIGQAHDLVQEAFIKLWESCKTVAPSKAKSFLFTLVSNAFKNELAHMKVRLKYQKHVGKDGDKWIETPEFQMEEKEFKARLEQAINELPSTQREVFLMSRIDQMTYKEIAQTLDVSVKAIEKRMGKALKQLKSKIKELQ